MSFQDWYATNKTLLNDRRKNRYKSDPDYRKDVLDTNRAAKERKKHQEQDRFIALSNEIRTKSVDELSQEVYPAKSICLALNVTNQKLSGLIRSKLVEPAYYENRMAHFHKDSLDTIKKLLERKKVNDG